MTITKEIWLKATAKAMSTEASKELFENDSTIEELFTDYSFHLLLTLSGKAVNREEFIKVVGDTCMEILNEVGVDMTNVLVNLALMCFASQIWENMKKLTKSDHLNSEYENFKTVLKSQKSE